MGMLNGKVALVTGASRGIGRAIAVALASEGATLEITARNESSLEETAKLCEQAGAASVTSRAIDLSSSEGTETLCSTLIEGHGRVDVLVNNAGVYVSGHALDGDPDDWERGLAVNVAAPMRLTRRLSPGMVDAGGGAIINIGSVAAIEGMTDAGAYAATKHALRGWSLSCYQKLRLAGIKVVLINPAFVDTEMTAGVSGADRSRMISPGDIADAAMLAVRTSPACCPEEITLRLTRSPFDA